jgi:hypothetical protein
VIVQVYLYVFIFPSAARGGKLSSKRGNAKIHGMTEVIPSTICYATIQVCQLLSPCPHCVTCFSSFRLMSHCVPLTNGRRIGRELTSGGSIFSSVNNWRNPATRGSWRHSSGGISFAHILICICISSQPLRKVFGDSSDNDEHHLKARETQGPTVRERMENERQRRMQAPAPSLEGQ